MRVVYEGPSPGVWIEPEGVYAARGEHTDVSDELAKRLAEQPNFTVPGLPDDADIDEAYPYHVGGGYYETSDGERIQGEQAAQTHQDTLDQQEE